MTDVVLSEARAAEFGTKLEFVSKNLETLFRDVSIILNTTAKLRVRTITFAEHLKAYSEGETPGLRQAMVGLSESVRQMEDHRRVLYDRLVQQVYQPLNAYAAKCQEARAWRQQRDRATRKAADAAHKSDGRAKETAEEERTRQDAVYVDRMRRFEEEKIADVKAIAGQWVHAHMEFSARSLELLSRAHQLVLMVDERPELAQSLRGVAPAVPLPEDEDDEGGDRGPPAASSAASPLRQEVALNRSESSLVSSRSQSAGRTAPQPRQTRRADRDQAPDDFR